MEKTNDRKEEAAIVSQSIRKQDGSDQCQDFTRGQGWSTESSGGNESELERIYGKTWQAIDFAFAAIGGILGQLIQQSQDRLAAHRDSITWYQDEVVRFEEQAAKAREGAEWHLRESNKEQATLDYLKTLSQSVSEKTE